MPSCAILAPTISGDSLADDATLLLHLRGGIAADLRDHFDAMAIALIPMSLEGANAFVEMHHRHHPPARGHKFSIGAMRDSALVGVAIVGRPVSRVRDDGATLEVTRLCTDGGRNVCSFLYGAAARATFALGFSRLGTYTLPNEGGASLRAAGWKLLGERGGGEWTTPTRLRIAAQHPTGTKWLWEASSGPIR